MIGGRHYCNHPARAVQQRPRPNNDSRPIANAAAGDSGQRDRTCCKLELADQITEYGCAVAGHFSSSVARSSVAAGKWFLQRLDGEKPDVFCHATQLMHGAEAARLTPLNAVDRMYVAARGFQPRGKPNHQQRYCVEHIARGTPQLSPSRRMARRAEPWCVSDT